MAEQQTNGITADSPGAAPARDPLSSVAIRQIALLAIAATVGFVLLMAALSWASDLTSSSTTSVGAIDVETGTITLSLTQEPPQLDSTRLTDSVSGMILGHVMEGLLRYDINNQLAPGVAERWDIRTDGATFWLREEARWSDGEPVTAHDFVFAWQTAVDPATASQYAFIFYVFKNAEAINRGELPRETLGARAVGDLELEIEFERPVAYFDKLVAFQTYYPIREDFYLSRDGRYAADAVDLLYNGPFEITVWVHGAHVRLEKNEHYWNRDEISLNVIDFPYITADGNAALNLYRDGQIAVVNGLGAESLDQVLAERWPVRRYSDGSVWFFQINHREEHPTSNYNLRKALQLVNDPGELVYKVIQIPGYTPGESLFPTWLNGQNGLFRQEYPAPTVTPNVALAREHLEQAKRELGVDEIPPIVLLADDTPGASKQAEYYQNRLMQTLGLDIRIDKQIFRQRLAKAEAGEFDLALYGWGPDFDDPLTFGDLFASWNLNNHGEYANADLDAQVRIAQESTDQATRMAAFGRIQEILIEDVAIIPNYERGVLYIQDPRLRGVGRRVVGPDPDYSRAHIVAD